jgi:tetratricopeptide (TPR) repeat protein
MEGILAEAGSLDFAGIFAPVLDFLADLDSGWQIWAGGGLCLLLLWRVVRARLAGTAEHRALRRQYKKLAKAGVAEWERPYRLFAGREDWNLLPDDFLMELTSRLIERDKVIDFIVLADAFDQAQQLQLARLAKGDPDTAMRDLSAFLTDVAEGLPAPEMVAMLGFAVRIDPENHWALIDLATEHYAAKRFAKALPLLEQALSLRPQAMVGLPRDRDARGRALAAKSPRLTIEKMHAILKVAGEMYEDCVERVGPKPI